MSKILIIDDEESIRIAFGKFLSDDGHDVEVASDYNESIALINQHEFDLIFSDIVLEGKTGIDILRKVREMNMNCPVIMITGMPDVETASEAIRLGAFDYLSKPIRKSTLLKAADMAIEQKRLTEENERYRLNLEAIFRSVKDAIVTVDSDLNLIEMNEAAETICALKRTHIGKPYGQFESTCGKRCHQVLEETIRIKQPVELYRIECNQPSRPDMVVNLSSFPLLNRQNEASGAVMVIKDETRVVRLEQEKTHRAKFHNIVGMSKSLQKIYSFIEDLADLRTTVLITGESGSGKELIAHALHHTGARHDKPFVKVSCSALTDTLLESELFGHIKGSFTGAINDKIGRFELADGGTIFLDEIGDISHRMQLRLLRVLQEKEFERVGDSVTRKVDIRVVAATNQNLKELVQKGVFREDLYYRLNVVEVPIPPLRERSEDIPLLVEHFLAIYIKQMEKKIDNISLDVLNMFMQFPWPGNVRQLAHVIEYAVIRCHHKTITLKDLPSEFHTGEGRLKPAEPEDERRRLINALEQSGWNKAKTARMLGISRITVYRKLKEFNITKQ